MWFGSIKRGWLLGMWGRWGMNGRGGGVGRWRPRGRRRCGCGCGRASTDGAAGQIPLALSGEEPVGVCVGDFDETQDRMGRDGATRFVVVPGPEGEAEGFGEHGTAVFPVQVLADLPDPAGQPAFDRLPFGIRGRHFHRGFTGLGSRVLVPVAGTSGSGRAANRWVPGRVSWGGPPVATARRSMGRGVARLIPVRAMRRGRSPRESSPIILTRRIASSRLP